jgi:hypothetical protein
MLLIGAVIAVVAAIAALTMPTPGDDALPAPEIVDAGPEPTAPMPTGPVPPEPAPAPGAY